MRQLGFVWFQRKQIQRVLVESCLVLHFSAECFLVLQAFTQGQKFAMDSSLVSKLKQRTREAVGNASAPGGPLEKGEFTMAVARRSISLTMGFGESGLDGLEWKGLVKKEVQKALVRTRFAFLMVEKTFIRLKLMRLFYQEEVGESSPPPQPVTDAESSSPRRSTKTNSSRENVKRTKTQSPARSQEGDGDEGGTDVGNEKVEVGSYMWPLTMNRRLIFRIGCGR